MGILRIGEANGPDVKAGELAVTLASARHCGGTLAGLSLDWSKCYDLLRLALLDQVAEAAGIPACIARPTHAAYALPRRVVADGLAGRTRMPINGLAPGCPAATDWLSMVVYCWKQAVTTRVPDAGLCR